MRMGLLLGGWAIVWTLAGYPGPLQGQTPGQIAGGRPEEGGRREAGELLWNKPTNQTTPQLPTASQPTNQPPHPLPSGLEPSMVAHDQVPKRWRFQVDPQDGGDQTSPRYFRGQVHRPCPYFDPAYDDSAWEEVPANHVWKGEGAAWYRAGLWWTPPPYERGDRGGDEGGPDAASLTGPLPGLNPPSPPPVRGFGPLRLRPSDGSIPERTTIYVNASRLQPREDQPLRAALRAALTPGYNLLAIKVERWPHALPDPDGPEMGEVSWRVERTGEAVTLVITQAEVRGEDSRPQRVRLRLVNPQGRFIATAELASTYLPTRFSEPLRAALSEFGRYHLELTVGQQTRRWAFHCLGLCFLHGTRNGFQPGSDRFLEDLLSRVVAKDRKHHALAQEGWLFEPVEGPPTADDTARLRNAIAAGQMDFVGRLYGGSDVSGMSGEELVRSLRYARHLYRDQLGMDTPFFQSPDGGLTPQLPQILRLGGYDTLVMGSPGSSIIAQDGFWRTADGTSLRVVDSFDYGLTVREIVRRAVRQGRNVALVAEESAALRRAEASASAPGREEPSPPTRFLETADAEALAQERILLRPVALAEYLAASQDFAQQQILTSDDLEATSGWGGGTPTEIVQESLRRVTEAHLVAVENLVTAARLWGLPSVAADSPAEGEKGREGERRERRDTETRRHGDTETRNSDPLVPSVPSEKEIDRLWKTCLLYGGGHPPPTRTADLYRIHQRAQEMVRAAAVALAQGVQRDREAVVVVNPLGWTRSGWVRVSVGDGPAFLAETSEVLTQQRTGSGEILFWAADVPPVGWRTYKLLRLPQGLPLEGPQVRVHAWGAHYVLENPHLQVAISPDGRLDLRSSGRRPQPATLHQLMVMKPEADRPPRSLQHRRPTA